MRKKKTHPTQTAPRKERTPPPTPLLAKKSVTRTRKSHREDDTSPRADGGNAGPWRRRRVEDVCWEGRPRHCPHRRPCGLPPKT